MGLEIDYQYDVSIRLNNEEKKKMQGARKERKVLKVIAEDENQEPTIQVEVKEEPQLKEEGLVTLTSQPIVLASLGQFIVEEMPTTERRPLNQAECQLLLSLLPKETLKDIVAQHYC